MLIQVMYVLTVVTTIFIPAQFLTGVYGMNFDVMPELHYANGYYVFWIVLICVVTTLLAFFKFGLKWL